MKGRVVAGLAAAVGAGLAVLASLSHVACSKEAPQPSAPEPIVVGVSLGLSKDLASFALPLRDAIRTAEGEINAGGGLLGRPVRFDIVDDRSDEGDGVMKVARDFADRGVVAVLGPVSSGQVKVTQGILAERKIIQITPSATSVELTDLQPATDRFLFRTTPADDFQGAAVMLFAARTPRGLEDAGADGGAAPSCKRLGVFYIDNPYGVSMAKVIAENFPRQGGTVFEKKVPLEAASSYATEAASMIADTPGCVAIIAYEKTAAQFVRDFKSHPGYAALEQQGFFFIGTDGLYVPGFLDLSRQDQSDETSPSTAVGVYGTNPDTQPGTVEYNAFRALYSSYFPLGSADAPAFAANTFDAAVLVALAIQKAGTVDDRPRIREALKEVSAPGGRPISPSEIGEGLRELREGRDIDYKGASGKVDLQSNGNVTSGFIVWQAVRDEATKKVVFKTVARFNSDVLGEQVLQ